MKDLNSLLGGYSCLVIGVVGTLVNVLVLVVLSSERKLSSQPTTAILEVITLLNILYNGLILPAQSVMYLERRLAGRHRNIAVVTRLNLLKCLLVLLSVVRDVRLLFLRPHGEHPLRPERPRPQQVLVGLHRDEVSSSQFPPLSQSVVSRLSRAQAYAVSVLSCLIPSGLLIFPASGSWGKLGYMEDTGGLSV